MDPEDSHEAVGDCTSSPPPAPSHLRLPDRRQQSLPPPPPPLPASFPAPMTINASRTNNNQQVGSFQSILDTSRNALRRVPPEELQSLNDANVGMDFQLELECSMRRRFSNKQHSVTPIMEEFKRAAAGECYLTFLSATEKANCARQQQLGRIPDHVLIDVFQVPVNELSAASSLLTMTEQIRKTIASAEAVAGEKCAEGDASVSIYRFEGVSKMFDAVISVYNTIRAVRQANTFGFPDNTHTYVSQSNAVTHCLLNEMLSFCTARVEFVTSQMNEAVEHRRASARTVLEKGLRAASTLKAIIGEEDGEQFEREFERLLVQLQQTNKPKQNALVLEEEESLGIVQLLHGVRLASLKEVGDALVRICSGANGLQVLNEPDVWSNGELPLHAAARLQRPLICQALIKAGADPLKTTPREGYNVLHRLARTRRGDKAIQVLHVVTESLSTQQRRVLLNAKCNRKASPFFLAARARNCKLCLEMYRMGAEPVGDTEKCSLSALAQILTTARCGEGKARSHNVNIHNQLVRFVNKDLFADISFMVEGQLFRAHRIVLCCFSEVLRSMLEPGWHDSEQKEIVLPEISAKAFREVLNYMYSGEARIPQKNVEIGLDILKLADRFLLYNLRHSIDRELVALILPENAFAAFYATSAVGDCRVRRKAVNCILSNYADLHAVDEEGAILTDVLHYLSEAEEGTHKPADVGLC